MATTTTTRTAPKTPKTLPATTATMKLKAPPSSAATLHSLYHRAARAFLLRQVPLVHTLLDSAFALLHPPEHFEQHPDVLAPYRSKWDLLRITLETTIYASPPPDLPQPLRDLLTQPPAALISAAYRRSLALFTPRSVPQKASYIPSGVILTLVYSSLKLEAPDAGRVIVEDWLASRGPSVTEEDPNYRKAVEAYCLYVLPKLEQWEYASEFLDYESELTPDTRESFKTSLRTLHAQAIAARLPRVVPPSPSLQPPRAYSPAPSSSSSSSSLSSTTSMHTVVPATPRPRTTSTSSASTVTPRARASPALSSLPSTSASPPRARSQLHPSPAHLPRLRPPNSASAPAPTTYALLHAALAPYLSSKTKLAAAAFSLLTFVLLLLLVRRRRASATGLTGSAGGAGTPSSTIKSGGDIAHAELVRRRLAAASAASGVGGSAGVLARALAAAVRVVGDTVKMGGSGLV
ncbi:hypothetical protein MSAN_00005000 [Mycena sanguinolenta]|uniref:Uncharacterized protein n=1 Tax=Mycena sanguinolenta TaxID=230812 RepID=A0A8H6ZGL7_9AGAR|nr:hypothetical protein MSAN_00005000 [Mycena sanguinolenta]